MYQNLGIHWASSIPAFLALACIPFPFLFYKYGKSIRLKCKYAAEAARVLEEMKGGSSTHESENTEESQGMPANGGDKDSGLGAPEHDLE
jgi:hypothetical protein